MFYVAEACFYFEKNYLLWFTNYFQENNADNNNIILLNSIQLNQLNNIKLIQYY